MPYRKNSNLRGPVRLFAGHPAGLAPLFFAELWERFSYYGMRALLALFMVAPVAAGGLGLTTAEAAMIYGNYTMAVYMLSIPGGYAADRLIGSGRAVLLGGAIIALGHFCLAVPMRETFYAGLALIVLGTGLFKPNVSALVGHLYAADDPRRDAGFSIFYMGINIGGLCAPLVTGFLAQSVAMKGWLSGLGLDPAMSWHWGFAAAGVGMSLGLLVLLRARRDLLLWERAPRADRQDWLRAGMSVLATAALMGAILLTDRPGFEALRIVYLLVPAALVVGLALSNRVEARRMAAVFVFFIAAMIFFAIFEQAGVTIAFFADQLMRTELLGLPFPSAWVQSLNPLFVILLAPLFAWLWMRLGDRQPSSPVKFALGLAFLSASFLLMVPAAILTMEGKISPLWLVGLFFLQTVGELLLSPVGLSSMTKLAPRHTVGLVLGIWFLAAALGNKLAGILGSAFTGSDPERLADYFMGQALFVGAAAAVLFILAPWVKRLMGGVR